eukprot:CAMPEP_0174914352 /NCGR_PEP_ID=MMETSP0167-20121228/80791_1 /TAXON_ID=38298 /ORGANISM="Rhodella maculata, Strain CCMP736" /LENGTH=150 /DNA_ID=CAMNT_0016159105 /DNA_START=419 /DNA_END=871 /DNA_ORIENTATION=-
MSLPNLLARAASRCARRSAPRRAFASGGPQEEFFNEPTGRMFGEPPLPPGVARTWESWEWIWYTTLGTGLGIIVLRFYTRPSTKISDWGHEEAKRRMGITDAVPAADEAPAAASAAASEDVLAKVAGEIESAGVPAEGVASRVKELMGMK